MKNIPDKLTKEEVALQLWLPDIYKEALEHAIWEMADDEDSSDWMWPYYFRSEVLKCEINNELNEKDKLSKSEYNTEAGWYQAGWKAALKAIESFSQVIDWASDLGTMRELKEEQFKMLKGDLTRKEFEALLTKAAQPLPEQKPDSEKGQT